MPLKILSDVKRFKQVLFNLLGNAVKFTMNGKIRVSIDYTEGILRGEVRDTGIGMKPEDLEKLF